MLKAPRWLLALVSISFGFYHAVLGALSWRSYENDWVLCLSLAIFVGAFIVAVVASQGLIISTFYGSLVAISAVATVIVANLGLGSTTSDPYATWYVGGMGALLGVLAARGQASLAWIAAALVTWQVYLKLGISGLAEVGLEGMVILIGAASATAYALKRADAEVLALQEAEMLAESSIISSKASSDERRNRLQNVLQLALPSLSFIAASKGQLSQEQRRKLIQLEASLRDDIRGRALLNEGVREAAAAARARGVDVLILDEGGLSEVSESQHSRILEKVVSALNSVTVGKIVIRSPRGEQWLVTVMATRPGTNAPDLWLKF